MTEPEKLKYPLYPSEGYSKETIADCYTLVGSMDTPQRTVALYTLSAMFTELAAEKHNLTLTDDQKKEWCIAIQACVADQAIEFIRTEIPFLFAEEGTLQ